jgi:FKBP-type peptidyl-prolyl cis-trans isomerase
MNKRAYIQENKDWLIAKSKEEGVKALPKGIYYRVLSEGDRSSAQPSPKDFWKHNLPKMYYHIC